MTAVDYRSLATLLVHAGIGGSSYGAVAMPVFESASFVLEDMEHHHAAIDDANSLAYYSRGYNPTVAALEARLAAIESAPRALAFSSGMAAIVTTLLTLCRGGGHVVVSDQVFETTKRWLTESFKAGGGQLTYADFTDLGEVKATFRPNTRAVFFEEFTNPLLQVLDLRALVDLADENGAQAVVDNTFASPVLLRPLEYGADLVLHSATKYLSAMGGSWGLTGRRRPGADGREGRAPTPDRRDHHAAQRCRDPAGDGDHGAAGGARLGNGTAPDTLATDHPATAKVNYPGLPDSGGHEIATRLTGGRYGGVFSFTLMNPSRKAAVYDAFELIMRATSLGDVATLVDSADNPDVLRISTGIEAPDDLAADLTQALDAAL